MDAPREIPFHQSANRPHLLLGGDRELVLVFGVMAAMLIFAVMTWWSIVAGLVLWLAAVAVLARMGLGSECHRVKNLWQNFVGAVSPRG